MTPEDEEHRGHAHHDGGGNPFDRGVRAFLRYLVVAPRRWRAPVNRAVVELLDVRPGESVLDIGAGTGPATVLAAQREADVTALDPTPFMRRVLRARRLFQAARRRIRVVDGTAEHLPFANESFDAVLSVNSMHHWSDIEAAVHEIARVVKPQGSVVLVEEDFDYPGHPAHKRMQRRHDHGPGQHLGPVEASDVGALLEEVGFENVEAGSRRLAGLVCRVVVARR